MADLKYSPDQYKKRFDPKTFLDVFYKTHEENEDEKDFREFHLKAQHRFWSSYKRIKTSSDDDAEVRCLEFGGGPSVSSLISAAPKVDRIVFAEFAEANRRAVLSWIAGKPEAHDWKPTIMYVVNDLEAEGDNKLTDINTEAILKREAKLKSVLKSFVSCDVFNTPIVDLEDVDKGKPFDVVTTSLCLEVCVASEDHFKSTVAKLSKLIKPGGYLRMDGVLGETFYIVGKEKYYVFSLTKDMVECAMKEAEFEDITIVVKEVNTPEVVLADCKFMYTAFGRKQ